MNITLTEKSFKTLEALAREDGVSCVVFLEKLLTHEDDERHSVWSRSGQKFVRTKCGLKLCQEKDMISASDRAD